MHSNELFYIDFFIALFPVKNFFQKFSETFRLHIIVTLGLSLDILAVALRTDNFLTLYIYIQVSESIDPI